MLDVLVSSRPGRHAGPAQVVLSTVFHVALIGGVALTTKSVAEQVADRLADTTFVFLTPPDPTPQPEPEQPRERAEQPLVTPPVAKGFQTIDVPDEIPTTIPPIDLKQKALDPRDFTGRGVEGGIADGVAGGITIDLDRDAAPSTALVYSDTQIDEPAQPTFQPQPKFPDVMRIAGITGNADMEFVVDTLGRVEPASIKLLVPTDRSFEEEARSVLLRSKFRPARMGGMAVRQLFRQRIRFELR